MKTLSVRLPEGLVAEIENESSERKLSISEVVRERLSRADVTGSVDGLPADLSARKKSHLKATGYGRKRPVDAGEKIKTLIMPP